MRVPLVTDLVEVAGRSCSLLRPPASEDRPYWADLWPSGVTLADELVGRDLGGRHVLELGCGLALPSLTALAGGADVLATDADRDAVRLAARNARRTVGRGLHTMVVDVAAPPAALRERAPFDLVVAADVLYTEELAHALVALLPAVVTSGGEVLVAYPFAGQARAFLAGLRGFDVTERDRPVPAWHGRHATVHVLRLQRRP